MSTRPPSAAVAQQSPGIRPSYRMFVARHEVAWELFFGGLAVVFVALAFVPVVPGSATDEAIYALEWLITGLFIAEFSSRLWAAESRRAYVRGHWIDLVSCIPPVRWARFFRLFRLLRLARTFAGIGRAMTHVERLGNHHGLMWLIIAWIAVMLLCAVGLFVVENGVNDAVDEPARRAVVGAHDDDDRRLRRRVPDDRRGSRRRRGADDPRHRPLLDHHRDRHELPDRGRSRGTPDLAGQLERLPRCTPRGASPTTNTARRKRSPSAKGRPRTITARGTMYSPGGLDSNNAVMGGSLSRRVSRSYAAAASLTAAPAPRVRSVATALVWRFFSAATHPRIGVAAHD